MKDSNIFIGTIKKCNNFYCYNQYGEERYVGVAKINNTEFGEIHRYVDTITEQAILIKVNESKYIWLNSITNFKDEILINIGIPISSINTFPSSDNELFVEKNTLKSYFESAENKNLSVNKLRKKVLADPRIKIGIQN